MLNLSPGLANSISFCRLLLAVQEGKTWNQ